ncbi:MAG: XdhC family protein [Dehalococcoidia bacterium]
MLELTKRLLAAADGSAPPVVVASILEAGPRGLAPGSRLIVEQTGETSGGLGDAALDGAVRAYAVEAFARHAAETVYASAGSVTLSTRVQAGATSIYLEVVEHRATFLIVGAGHIGRCLATLASFLDFHVAIIDDREDFAAADRVPEADEVICEDFEVALEAFPIDGNTCIVMVTRGHKQDELSLRKCLGRGAGYVGMIGSKRRTAAVLEHLAAEGFDAGELGRVRTPIGLDIGAETPEEIAVSIMAEVIMLRRGGTGAAMYHRAGPLRA